MSELGKDDDTPRRDFERDIYKREQAMSAAPVSGLQEKPHFDCEDCWYSCATLTCDDRRYGPVCDCGADEFNTLQRALQAAERELSETRQRLKESEERSNEYQDRWASLLLTGRFDDIKAGDIQKWRDEAKRQRESVEQRLKVADEMVALFIKESEPMPSLPIEGHEAWTDWITMVLKNCGAFLKTSR